MTDAGDLINQSRQVSNKDFSNLIQRVVALLGKEQRGDSRVCGRLLRLQPSGFATIVGDLHGDLESLRYILMTSNFLNFNVSDGSYIVFLGDYGDRGPYSLEVYYTVLKLKEMFPARVVLMMGNHEAPRDLIPYPHDLPVLFREKYGEAEGSNLYNELRELFRHLYTTVLVERQIVMVHGGVPFNALSFGDLAFAYKTHEDHQRRRSRKNFSWKELNHSEKNAWESNLEQLLWSDPAENLVGAKSSPRGIGRLFGRDVTERFLKMLDVAVLIRGHESSDNGFKMDHGGKVLTLFSTKQLPYNNRYAAYLQLNLSEELRNAEQLKPTIKQF
ncbi:serine/threonine protein phosphatase [Candidatus Bathyarchaeota archaeon]|nr:serine/threonine protein phosphatase [Candidatus Bathyarchaeota archaeon]